MKLKATVTLVVEYEMKLGQEDDDLVDFFLCDVLDPEKAKFTANPASLLDMPGCQVFAKVEEV